MISYVRPRFLKFRRNHRNLGFVSSLWYTLTRKRPAGTTSVGVVHNRSMLASSCSARVALKSISSGMTSLIEGVKKWMTSDSKAPPAFTENEEVITLSPRQERNHVDDEECTNDSHVQIIEYEEQYSNNLQREEGDQQEEDVLLCEDHSTIEKRGNDAVL